MYKSVRKLLNIPVVVKPYVKFDGAGDKTYGPDKDEMCYVSSVLTTVTNFDGVEVTSNIQLYLDGMVVVKQHDDIILHGKRYTIKAIGTFYDKGKPDLLVVYM